MTALIERPTTEDIAARKYTAEDFETLPDDGKEYELIDGELIEMKGASGRHSEVITTLATELKNFVKTNKTGRVFTNGPVALSDKDEPRPDVLFVAAGKLPDDFEGPILAIPDLVVEVNSPSDTTKGIHDKLVKYRAAGVRLIWSVFLLERYVLIYHLGKPKI